MTLKKQFYNIGNRWEGMESLSSNASCCDREETLEVVFPGSDRGSGRSFERPGANVIKLFTTLIYEF
jgi:hypothetical protein